MATRGVRRFLWRVLCAALCLALFCGAAVLPASADASEPIKVGFFAFDGYHMQDAQGNRFGYGYEYLQHLAGYAGFRYAYIGYDKSWNEMQDMLARGEIDLLTSAQKTPEREARFDFSEMIGVSAAILTARVGDARYLLEDYENWDGMRVGMLPGNSRNDGFADFAAAHGFSYVPVYYRDTDALVADLAKGDAIDAILTSNLRRTTGETILLQYDASPFYMMVRKGDDALRARIDAAIARMDNCEPGLRTELMNKYYAPAAQTALALTAEERRFVERMQGTPIRALINPDRAPYASMRDGALTGIACEALREIFARSGLPVEFADAPDEAAYLALADSGEAVLRVELADGYNTAESEGYWLTPAFLEVPLSRLARKDASAHATAAVPANRDFADDTALLAAMGYEPAEYESLGAAIDAVYTGARDAAFLPTDIADRAVRDDVTNRLVATEIFGKRASFVLAVRNDQDPLLYAVLSKAVASFGEYEADAIRQHYGFHQAKPFTLIGYLYDYPLHVLIGAATVLLVALLIALLVAARRRRRRELALMREEQRRSELLKDALAKAERADAAKSQFLSRVSHELRTPLNAIIGFIELAKDADEEKKANYIASSDIAAKQLLGVINDVLDMSSIESGKMRIAHAPFDFRRLVSSITNVYGAQCKQKGLEYETRITTPVDDYLVGDELRVHQILANLLGNAVKFTAHGRICLTISERAGDAQTAYLRFQVSDTGVGMSDTMLARLFKPFEQESAETARKFGGSGLGLSIVKNLAGMMNGSVAAESETGVGTTFTVDIPFQRGEGARVTAPGGSDRLRALVVDDESSERDYMTLVLTRMGVRHSCVSGGNEALDELERGVAAGDPYNICLVDWRMPGLTGDETTRRIRARYGEDMIVIVVSAYDFQQAWSRAQEAGANLFLSKPVFQSSLFDLLMTLTGGKVAQATEQRKAWSFAGKRVLLVEDNALNQVVVQNYLTRYGIAYDTAEDGRKAVDLFTASEPGTYDAILMDIQMPVMDGIEATKAIRASAHPQAKTIQIIAQSADAFNEDVARVLSCGMNAHVAKPLRPELLAQALSKAFSVK